MAGADGPELLAHCRIASFVASHGRGNAHRVELYRSDLPTISAYRGEDTLVELVLPEQSASATRVRFSRGGRPIARCGSGTLAAAHALQREWRLEACRLLDSGIERLETVPVPGGYAYIATTLPLRLGLNPLLAAPFFDAIPCGLSASGGPSDYFIVEFASPEEVQQLQVHPEQIARHTRRALIATAVSPSCDWDYVLRYFAPQYGVAEDPATGSGNLMAAHYWQNRLGKRRVRGWQCSPTGGECWVEALEPWSAGRALRPRRQLMAGRTKRLSYSAARPWAGR